MTIYKKPFPNARLAVTGTGSRPEPVSSSPAPAVEANPKPPYWLGGMAPEEWAYWVAVEKAFAAPLPEPEEDDE